jgi:hypothetical protein
MIFVFIIMMNVLIAVVCDNYSFAMSKAHEIFLRSRLQTVANLDMQGFTKLRNTVKHSRQSVIGAQFKIIKHQESNVRVLSSTASTLMDGDDSSPGTAAMQHFEQGDTIADWLDHFLKDSLWHRYMRKVLGIQRQTELFRKTIGRLKEQQGEVSLTATEVNKWKLSQELKRNELIDYFEERLHAIQEQQMMSETQIITALEQKMAAQIDALKAALLKK